MNITAKDAEDLLRIINLVPMRGEQAERIVELKQKLMSLIPPPGPKAFADVASGKSYNNDA
jgi:hypothetical protein